jgi:heptosyltransferase-2
MEGRRLPDGQVSRQGGKILVIRGGAIGDFILTLPVLAALRTQFPQAQLEVLGYAHVAQLARAGGLADDVRSIEARSLAGFFAREGELSADLRDYFAGFAIIISYLYDPDQIFQTNIARCSPAQFIQGPHRPDDGARIHATEVLLKPLERLAIFDADPVPRLNVGQVSSLSRTDQDLVFSADRFAKEWPLGQARDRLEACPTLAVHPGSGSEQKNWPETKWAELLERLGASRNGRFLLVGGEAEADRLERLMTRLPAAQVELASNLPLAELAKRLAGCVAFVGHDSGITHLAAALGVSGIVLWGDTERDVWRPRSERMKILTTAGGLANLAVDAVATELNALLTAR